MRVEALFLRNFRNYQKLELNFDLNLNILTGANGQGKTNLLEALTFLAAGRSYRVRNDAEMITWGENSCAVAGKIVNRLGTTNQKIIYDNVNKSKKLVINGQEIQRALYAKSFTTVIFTPDHLEIVKGAPQLRRRFLDDLLSKVSPVYEHELGRFQLILKQRNYLLKMIKGKQQDKGALAGWDEQLARYAVRISAKRSKAVHRLGLLARLLHRRLTDGDENLEILYNCASFFEEGKSEEQLVLNFMAVLEKKREEEFRFGQTMAGPHRDDLILSLNGREARLFASQGQQRTMVLALKMAELEFIRGECGEFPVLLFDDVFSELDLRRRKLLMESIDGRVQTFITGTDPEKTGAGSKGSILNVSGGEVRLVETNGGAS